MLRAVKEMGFEQCTPIQAQAIPVLLQGNDVIGQAQTGTGKTVAFGIPVVEKVDPSQRHVQAIIMCPTRELAIQVSEEIQKLIRFKPGTYVTPIYGGQAIDRQIRTLKQGVHIVIGTPGRILDHLERGSLKLQNVGMIVLDEADEMLDMGFREDIETILKELPQERQTIFFSATMPKPILALTKTYQKDPVSISIMHKELTVSNIQQKYLELPERNKMEALSRLIDVEDPALSLVFCNTKRKVNDVVSELQARGYFADGLHGDLKQNERNAVMDKFKKGIVDILVATDVAARGLDIDNVEAVFNYDIPLDEESYVHRIGRTGRAGKSGISFTFVTSRETYQLRDIERYTKSKIGLHTVPSLNEVEEKRMKVVLDNIKSEIEKGSLSKYITLIETLIEEHHSSVEIAAALLKLNMGPDTNKEIPEEQYAGAEPGMARLFVNLGRKQRIAPKDLVGAIANEANIPGKSIGAINIYDEFSFVEVPKGEVEAIIAALKGRMMKGKKLLVQLARKRT